MHTYLYDFTLSLSLSLCTVCIHVHYDGISMSFMESFWHIFFWLQLRNVVGDIVSHIVSIKASLHVVHILGGPKNAKSFRLHLLLIYQPRRDGRLSCWVD